MNKLARCGLIVAIALTTRAAHAKPPSPVDSTIPCGILFVGRVGTIGDRIGEFEIVVRDLAQNPMPAVPLRIVFDQCMLAGDLRLASEQPDASVSAICGPGPVELRATTEASGAIRSRFVGGGSGNATGGFSTPPTCSAGSSGGCAVIYADGYFFSRVAVARLDADGANGLGPPDIACWLADSFAPGYLARSDFDFSGVTSAPDLSILLRAILAEGSQSSAATYCQ